MTRNVAADRKVRQPWRTSVAECSEVTTYAPQARRARALDAVGVAARSMRELTVEDVSFPPAVPDAMRTWAMAEAERLGQLRALGWVSGTEGRHGRPVRLYASTTYRGPDATP